MTLKQILLITCCLVSCAALATAKDNTAASSNKGYADVMPSKSGPRLPTAPGKVVVVEFFSFGCPACYHFESTLEAWEKTKPAYVQFERIPATFEEGWSSLATAYYTAKQLNVADQVTPALFDAIWKEGKNLSDEAILEQVITKHSPVTSEQFKQAYEFSPMMAASVLRGETLMEAYQVQEIPTLVIDGRYKTSVSLAGSPEKTIAVLNDLITKARQSTSVSQGSPKTEKQPSTVQAQ